MNNVVKTGVAATLMAFVMGLASVADAGTLSRPNIIEGGYTYYFNTTDGNTEANTNNVYGRYPMKYGAYVPEMGKTNAIYLARGDTFTVATNYEFRGTSKYTDAISKSASSALYGLVQWSAPTDEKVTFTGSENNTTTKTTLTSGIPVYKNISANTAYSGNGPANLYFTNTPEGGETQYGMLQVYTVNRSDAFYRLPLNNIFYVPTGASLWFRKYDGDLASPWVAGSDTTWTLTTDTAAKYDKFTIHAAAGETVYIKSVDNSRDITVHVVDPETFKFSEHTLFYHGLESRKLSSILYQLQLDYTIDNVASVVSVSGEIRVTSAYGDWNIESLAYVDVDREVTVTMKNGDVVLLKITTMTGRLDPAFCANCLPKVKYGSYEILLTDDSGKLMTQPVWVSTTSRNTPPGYENVMFRANSVLYQGKRYSAYMACKDPDFVTNEKTAPAGQFRCSKTLMQVVCWLEDENGDMFVSPLVCWGNCAYSDLNPTFMDIGKTGYLYTDDFNLALDPYLGTKLSAQGKFQGTTADEYGYCSFVMCTQHGICDELTVFCITGIMDVEVRKEVIGTDTGDRFVFEAIYSDPEAAAVGGKTDALVTNRFVLASGETFSFSTALNGTATVREIVPEGYVASLRANEVGTFKFENSHVFTNIQEKQVLEFRNEKVGDFDPIELWITDHDDAGAGIVHLAFEPFYLYKDLNVGYWLSKNREKKSVRLAMSPTREGLRTAESSLVTFRDGTGDQDVTNNWIWITAEVPSTLTNGFKDAYAKITVDQYFAGYNSYSDEIIGASVTTGLVTRIQIGPEGSNTEVAYQFMNFTTGARVVAKRRSRIESVLLVGGGGAGGGSAGGGGGGGEVKVIDGSEFPVLKSGETFYLEVGAGGSPASVDSIQPRVVDSSYNSTDAVTSAPGGNGGPSTLVVGEVEVSAQGGGGGGSTRSTMPGVVDPKGLGQNGANGGGSSGWGTSMTGGVATVTGGFAGGGASSATAGNGCSGGGGGMDGAGANGANSAPGAGGAGVQISFAGSSNYYGAGGGGGGSYQGKTGAAGGTHAGKGGDWDPSSNAVADMVGGDAEVGFGGGGGGGGGSGNSTGANAWIAARGGKGGSGRVVVVLRDASVLDAECAVTSVAMETAELAAEITYDEIGNGVNVSYAVVQHGGTLSYTSVTNGAQVGAKVAVPLTGLNLGTTYDYAFKFVNASGYEYVLSGTFTTLAPNFDIGYQDANLVASKEFGNNISHMRGTNDYFYIQSTVCTNAKIMLKRSMTFYGGLLVGGGGAGGAVRGAGGGGGGVTDVSDLQTYPAGTVLTLSVGTGGLAPKKATGQTNNPGDATVLTMGDMTHTALGGGVGASYPSNQQSSIAGGNGANGGGGWGATGAGGTSTDGKGHSGGAGNRKLTLNYGIGGGGGGAFEDGHAAVQGTPNAAGSGGEGVPRSTSGTQIIYGSGGGGGGDSLTDRGLGGTGAGDGGVYTAKSSDSNAGGAGTDGQGGGGGGAGSDTTTYTAGKGGSGVAIFGLAAATATNVAAVAVDSVSALSAKTIVNVVALDGNASTKATVARAIKKSTDANYGALTEIATDVAAKTQVTDTIIDLDPDTIYEVQYQISYAGAVQRMVTASFRTYRLDFTVGYSDSNILASSDVGIVEDPKFDAGNYQLSLTRVCTNGTILLRKSMKVYGGILVGGGGAGGASVGGGGGGGGVLDIADMTTLDAGTYLKVTVGAGGVNTSGGVTRVSIGKKTYEVLGGGVGASRNGQTSINGGAGANGGGGMGVSGAGGISEDGGYAGGAGNKQGSGNNNSIGGGGGGAGMAGIAAKEGVPGAGGDGVPRFWNGVFAYYGSGGGAGGVAGTAVAAAHGGGYGFTGAGGDGSASTTAAVQNSDGYGAGGGGGSDKSNTAARGGHGTVRLGLATGTARMLAAVSVRQVGIAEGHLRLNVVALDGTTTARATVRRAYKRDVDGAEYGEWTTLATGVAAGEMVNDSLHELDAQTRYRVKYELSGTGLTTTEVEGVFMTKKMDFEIAYQDDNLVVSETIGASAVYSNNNEYVIVVQKCITNASIVVRKNLVLTRALLVGGGGAGGSTGGGGGGGGGVMESVSLDQSDTHCQLLAGSEMTISVGAGGCALGPKSLRNENGGLTSLDVGDIHYNVLGGGAGASGNKFQDMGGSSGIGWDGANGGGAASYDNNNNGVAGGQPEMEGGFPGGDSARAADVGAASGALLPGGGGGAGSAGETPVANGTKAGKGGLGLTFNINVMGTMTEMVFAAGGGGGGASVYVTPGDGGHANAGNGGHATGAHPGSPAIDGFGGGGGGGSATQGHTNGGQGGCGAIVIHLRIPQTGN